MNIYWRVIVCVLLAGLVIAAAYSHFLWISPATYTIKLGEPGPHNQIRRLNNLSLDIVLEQDRNRVLSRQANGKIVAWDLRSGSPQTIAQTEGLYGYCRNRQFMLLSNNQKIVLLDLNQNIRHDVIDGTYHHAAWSNNCSVFALANADANQIELWRTEDLSRVAIVKTDGPVRNGLALSDDGTYLAAAEGTHSEKNGHDTNLEIFSISKGNIPARITLLGEFAMIFGMWKMVFLPQQQTLFVGTQNKGRSGLRNITANNGETVWRHDGFASSWVRALAVPQTGDWVVSGDESGLLRAWDVKSGKRQFQKRTGLVIQALSFSEDGKKLAVALWDSTIGIIDLQPDMN